MLTALVLGALVGAVLGLTGAGGGILAVPALVFGLGWTISQSTPVALLAVAGAALVGAIEGLARGLVRYRAAAVMALAGIAMTPLGVRAAQALPETVLLLLFTTAMLIVAARMYRQAGLTNPGGDAGSARSIPCHIDPATGRLRWTPATAVVLILIGSISGLLTGLLGVGGGFVIVPALRRMSDISMHGVVATSLAVIALVAGAAVIAASWQGAALSVAIAGPFAAGAGAGMLAGRLLVRHLSPSYVQRSFALVTLMVAAGLTGNSCGMFA